MYVCMLIIRSPGAEEAIKSCGWGHLAKLYCIKSYGES